MANAKVAIRDSRKSGNSQILTNSDVIAVEWNEDEKFAVLTTETGYRVWVNEAVLDWIAKSKEEENR